MTELEIAKAQVEELKKTVREQERRIDSLEQALTFQDLREKTHDRYLGIIEKITERRECGY